MSDMHDILRDTATSVFRDRCRPETVTAFEQGTAPTELWRTLEETGLALASIPEAAGGSGGTLADAAIVLRIAGRFAAPVPLAETLLAAWVLAASGRPVPPGPMTVAPMHPDDQLTFELTPDGWTLSGSARRVPWGHHAARIVVLGRAADELIVGTVDPATVLIAPGKNLAAEPRDDLDFTGVRVDDAGGVPPNAGIDEAAVWTRGALLRSLQMAGALERVLEQAVTYATERTQFGRPIARFQAIQQHLAVLAGEVAAAGAAADAAVLAAEGGPATAEIAAAKIRASEAAGVAATIAHQVHGAIGFTYEHTLHHSTRRLWSWRDEFGNETVWALRLGDMIAAQGPAALWSFVSGVPGL